MSADLSRRVRSSCREAELLHQGEIIDDAFLLLYGAILNPVESTSRWRIMEEGYRTCTRINRLCVTGGRTHTIADPKSRPSS